MRRIEIAPTENPFLECFDRCAACFIRVFERSALPKGWTGLKRIFFLLVNFVLLASCYASDWIFFTCWPRLGHSLQKELFQNSTKVAAGGHNEKQIFEILKTLYLFCLVASAILLSTMQCFISLFVVWRKSWRQTLVLVAEMIALTIQICMPPLLISILFLTTKIGIDQEKFSLKQECGWQLLVLAVTHSIFLLFWEGAKLVSLGLCCCCCFTCCIGVWPLYKTCKTVCYGDSDSENISHSSNDVRRKNFAATVLDFMPPESDRGSWLAGAKWCLITFWTFPLTLVSLVSSSFLIAVIVLDRNFIYYPLWVSNVY